MTEPVNPPPPAGAEAPRPGNPWDRRRELGLGPALLEALKRLVLAPAETYARTRERGDYAGPLIFAIVVGWICAAIGQLWQLVFGSSLIAWLPGDLSEQLGPMFVSSWIGFLAQFLFTPLYIVVALFIYSAILHLSVMIVGGLAASRSGFEGTFRTLSYATVANFGQVIPILGGLVVLVWSIALQTIGIASLHRTGTGRALIAVLLPLVVCCVCVGVAALLFGATLMALIAGQQ